MKPPAKTHTGKFGVILDMDGTLMRGVQPLKGLKQLFDFLHLNFLPYTIVTNNATHSPEDYQNKLAKCGVQVKKDHILTSALGTAAKLRGEYPQSTKLYVLGQPALHAALAEAGFDIITDAKEPVSAVVIGGDPQLTYEKLKNATLHLQKGASFIGTNPDVLYPTEEGLVPECGTILAALNAASGLEPTIIGKPAPTLFEQAMDCMHTEPENTFVVGDRLETDILGGQRAGCQTILITTGVDGVSSVKKKAIQPNFIVDDLPELAALLTNKML